MRLMTWSTPVSGIASTSLRVSTVVLTSSFSRSDPRPALTVTGGRVTGAAVAGVIVAVVAGDVVVGDVAGGGVSCALASAGISARPANAASVAARTDSMKFSHDRQTNATRGKARSGFRCQTREGGARGWLGPSRMPTGPRASTATGGRSTRTAKSGVTTNDAEGAARVGAWARPRQHSCILPAAGI